MVVRTRSQVCKFSCRIGAASRLQNNGRWCQGALEWGLPLSSLQPASWGQLLDLPGVVCKVRPWGAHHLDGRDFEGRDSVVRRDVVHSARAPCWLVLPPSGNPLSASAQGFRLSQKKATRKHSGGISDPPSSRKSKASPESRSSDAHGHSWMRGQCGEEVTSAQISPCVSCRLRRSLSRLIAEKAEL